MVSVVTDRAGRITAVARRVRSARKNPNYLTLTHPDDGFLLINASTNDGQMWVRYLRPDLTEAWIWSIGVGQGLIDLAATAVGRRHLWLAVTDCSTNRRLASTSVVCLDLHTGAERSCTALDALGQTHTYISTATLTDSVTDEVLVAGQYFDKPRPSSEHNGDLLMWRLRPDGSHPPPTRLTLRLPAPRHLHWQHAELLPTGAVRLIGETYTTTPRFAAQRTRAVAGFLLTLPIRFIGPVLWLGHNYFNYTTLRSRGLLLTEVSPTGTLGSLRTLDLPDGANITYHGYWPPYLLAAAATRSGAMQWRRLSPDGRWGLTRGRRAVGRFALDGGGRQPLANSSRAGSLDVWGFTGPSHTPLLVESLRGARRVRLLLAR